MVFLPVIGAGLEAVGSVLSKRIVNRHNVNYKNYIVYAFLSIVIISLPLALYFWRADPIAFSSVNLSLFGLIVLFSILANCFIIYALKRDSLSELTPMRLTAPLFTILIAFIFSFFFEVYTDERNYSVLFFALVASVALIIAHVKRDEIVFDKYSIFTLIGSFLFAVEMVLSKPLLGFYNPITFYFIRSLWIFVITLLIFHPKVSSLKSKAKWMIFGVSIIFVLYRVIIYYGYLTLGIVFTTSILVLAPVLIFVLARIFLKEKVTRKQVISSLIIVLCVLGAIWVGG
ncbi:hypothetical protein CMI42_05545 [Candidatus Pacearchaeota archaeon]|nr:hypothetical protein [Candidatus Pacearchaeota archaeon]